MSWFRRNIRQPLAQVVHYLRDFLHEDFHPVVYTGTAVFLAIAIWANYTYDLNATYIRAGERGLFAGHFERFFSSIWAYGLAWFVPLGIRVAVSGWPKTARDKRFWWAIGIGLAAYAVYVSLYYYRPYIEQHAHPLTHYFWLRTASNLTRSVPAMLVIAVYWWWADRKTQPFYGFAARNFDARPYWLMLALMIPLILYASFTESFQQAYPRYVPRAEAQFWDIARWKLQLLYELAYGADFIWTEFFFRGFLVLAFARFLGTWALLPMLSFYCTIHFGKPALEAISSIFGGGILGVVAYYSRSIWGGIMIHLGVAWLMELFAYGQRFW